MVYFFGNLSILMTCENDTFTLIYYLKKMILNLSIGVGITLSLFFTLLISSKQTTYLTSFSCFNKIIFISDIK